MLISKLSKLMKIEGDEEECEIACVMLTEGVSNALNAKIPSLKAPGAKALSSHQRQPIGG